MMCSKEVIVKDKNKVNAKTRKSRVGSSAKKIRGSDENRARIKQPAIRSQHREREVSQAVVELITGKKIVSVLKSTLRRLRTR